MRDVESLPVTESMKAAHRIRRFRRSNVEHPGSTWRTTHNKPWRAHNNPRSTAA